MESRAKLLGHPIHQMLIVVVLLFAFSWLMRGYAPRAPEGLALAGAAFAGK